MPRKRPASCAAPDTSVRKRHGLDQRFQRVPVRFRRRNPDTGNSGALRRPPFLSGALCRMPGRFSGSTPHSQGPAIPISSSAAKGEIQAERMVCMNELNDAIMEECPETGTPACGMCGTGASAVFPGVGTSERWPARQQLIRQGLWLSAAPQSAGTVQLGRAAGCLTPSPPDFCARIRNTLTKAGALTGRCVGNQTCAASA